MVAVCGILVGIESFGHALEVQTRVNLAGGLNSLVHLELW